MSFEVINGDALSALQGLEKSSFNACITSPPYYRLRDYGVDGQIGLEGTAEEYIARLVAVFAEVRRVLRDDGTLWVVIGDSYSGSGKGAAKYEKTGTMQTNNQGSIGCPSIAGVGSGDGCKPKDMIGIPWKLAFALRDDGWYLRQDIIWAKPNPMPESVTDRCTKSHEHVFMFTKRPHYRYFADAIKEDAVYADCGTTSAPRGSFGGKRHAHSDFKHISESFRAIRQKRNKRDVWNIATRPFTGAHFATFPEELVKNCLLASTQTGDVVLDPFGGSGTVGKVAVEMGRKAVLVELNPDYCSMARKRIDPIDRQGVLDFDMPWKDAER